ncbi:MAG: type 2 isopentenyl-diphosphate Delta-isomerase, partial [Anaerolineales bacterium]
GGTAQALQINQRLAEAAEICGVAMGVGSQRAALEHPELRESFRVVRRAAPQALIFANLGAVQLNYGYGLEECRRAVEMVEAQALILHLNPLQEALQAGGNTRFSGLLAKIEAVCRSLDVPVVVKEVGWGISERVARQLAEAGVTAIDVAGAGGTSWSQVEMHRASDDFTRQLAATFVEWGIPTAQSILNVRRAAPDMMVFASGGLRNGLEIAKCLALGAKLGGMASPFLKAAAISTEKVIETIRLTSRQIQVTMFACGAASLKDLNPALLEKSEP